MKKPKPKFVEPETQIGFSSCGFIPGYTYTVWPEKAMIGGLYESVRIIREKDYQKLIRAAKQAKSRGR